MASLHEIPAPCRPVVEDITGKLGKAGLGGMILIGKANEPVCEIPVGSSKVGMILQSGLNPVAAAVERGIEVVNRAMSGMIDYRSLRSFWDL
jgi:repressor of nif and glnA expression